MPINRSTASPIILAAAVTLAPLGARAQDADLPRLPNPVIVAEKLAGRLVRLDADTGELVDCSLDPEKAIDHFLFYYSAGWNPTCAKFTPALIKFYNEQKAAGANFEIVFVSVDDTEAEMKTYMAGSKMPWPALRFGLVDIGPQRVAEEGDRNREAEAAPEEGPVDFIKDAAGRGVPCVVVMDSRGLILAHSYRRRKDYLGPEKPLEEFSKLLAAAAEKRAAKGTEPAPGGAE